jgi:hypothetical protein
VSPQDGAQRFFDQLRAQTCAALGIRPGTLDPAAQRDLSDRFLRESLNPAQRQDPRLRALVEQEVTRAGQNPDESFDEMLAVMQDRIEATAASRIDGVDLALRRPLVGRLPTGQLNAVSMRVPGRSGAYLVLIEDQLALFASKLSKAVAWAIPHGPADGTGNLTFQVGVPTVTERIRADPEVAERFAEIVVAYATTGTVGAAGHHLLPPGYLHFAYSLVTALEYFVLGHEYAHILNGHLDTTPVRTGALPATEAEALAYSWQQELDADLVGMILSINALIDHERLDMDFGFAGIGLFFDALDVMDRAVALLQTGDENARQIGSHPPSELRKQRLREFLPRMAGDDSERAKVALGLAEVQGEIIRLLWERARPVLVDLRRRGVPAALTWRTVPKETAGEPAPR